jgi:RNase H-like domain found in reverse transcriptase/Integrase zinc binding domain
MKKLLAADAMLAYLDHNLPFDIYTDASDFQLGSVVVQNKCPVAYYTCKLNSAQHNYTVIEKELLGIVETFCKFCSMLLLGAVMTVYTDHCNLTYSTLNTQRVLCWQLYLEEFSPTFTYIPGPMNVLADFFSRSPTLEGQDEPHTPDNPTTTPTTPPTSTSTVLGSSFDDELLFLDPVLLDCFLNDPFPALPLNPVSYSDLGDLSTAQVNQPGLQNLHILDPQQYSVQQFGNFQLLCHTKQNEVNWKIVVRDAVLPHIVTWYHTVLHHSGVSTVFRSLDAVFYHRNLHRVVEEWIHVCDVCQQNELSGPGYGELLPREALFQPWYEVAIDMIGPWLVIVNGESIAMYAITMIDTVTNLVELFRIDTPSAANAAWAFEMAWLVIPLSSFSQSHP